MTPHISFRAAVLTAHEQAQEPGCPSEREAALPLGSSQALSHPSPLLGARDSLCRPVLMIRLWVRGEWEMVSVCSRSAELASSRGSRAAAPWRVGGKAPA